MLLSAAPQPPKIPRSSGAVPSLSVSHPGTQKHGLPTAAQSSLPVCPVLGPLCSVCQGRGAWGWCPSWQRGPGQEHSARPRVCIQLARVLWPRHLQPQLTGHPPSCPSCHFIGLLNSVQWSTLSLGTPGSKLSVFRISQVGLLKPKTLNYLSEFRLPPSPLPTQHT